MIVLIGDIIKQRTIAGQTKEGKVIAVNYKYGWYTLEFTTPTGKYREAFFMKTLADEKVIERTSHAKGSWSDNPKRWLDDEM